MNQGQGGAQSARQQSATPRFALGPRSFAWHIGAMAVGLILPALIFIAILLWQFAQSERLRIEGDARALAGNLAVLVAQQINDTTTTLQALATSPSLKGEDLAAFYEQAMLLRQQQNQNFSVRDADGVTLLTTRLPFGVVIRNNPPEVTAADAAALSSRGPVASSVFTGPVTQAPNLQIVVPVLTSDPPRLVVGASMDFDVYQGILSSFTLSAQWSANIIDANGNFIARRPFAREMIGRPAAPDFRMKATSAAGLYYGRNSAGTPSLIAYDSVPITGWRVSVSAPSDLIDQSLFRSVLTLAVAGLLLGSLGFWLAWVMRRRMARSVEALSAVATSLENRTEIVEPARTVTDIANVGDVMSRAAREIAASERRLRRVLDNLFAFVGLLDLDGKVIEANEAPLAAAGLDRTDVIGVPFWDCYWWSYDPAVQDRIRAACGSAALGATVRFDIAVRVKDGRFITIDFLVAPLRADDGRIVATQPTGVDITERIEAQRTLALSQARLKLGVEAAELGLAAMDYRAGTITLDDRTSALFALPADTALPRDAVHARFHPEERPAILAAIDRLLAGEGGGFMSLEHRILLPSGEIRWLSARKQLVFDVESGRRAASSGILAVQDITARKKAEVHRTLLINELNHRVKNTLATVHSIASQSFRSVAESMRPQIAAFDERLHAMGRTHEILTRGNWERADLGEVARYTLSPYAERQGPARVVIDGPPAALTPQQALAISMALHELATNAVKYGALSNADGRIDLSWTLFEDGITILWQESGGPTVRQPTRQGFGTRLLKRALQAETDSRVDLDYRPDGLRCVISFRSGANAASAAADPGFPRVPA